MRVGTRSAMGTEVSHSCDSQGQTESQWDHQAPAEDQVITDNLN